LPCGLTEKAAIELYAIKLCMGKKKAAFGKAANI
jgi:hypothetical protein